MRHSSMKNDWKNITVLKRIGITYKITLFKIICATMKLI